MLKKIFFSNYGILCAVIVFFAAVVLLLNFKTGWRPSDAADFISYYAKFALISAKRVAIWTTLALFFWLIVKTFIFYFTSFKKRRGDGSKVKLTPELLLVQNAKSFRRESKEIFKATAAIAAVLFLATSALAKINFLNRVNLKDELLLKIDRVITGGYPFILLDSLKYPAWFIWLIEFSFLNLPLFMIIAAVYFFYKNKTIFFKYVSAFALGLPLLFIIWILAPALSPQDRFIDNVYKLPLSAEISSALTNYKPQQEIKNFLLKERFYKNGLKNMSTSTMPSSHVFWAFILGYYLFRLNKKAFWPVLPVLIFSTIGTVLFAQHYFVDVPAAILMGAPSVALTEIYFNYLRRRV